MKYVRTDDGIYEIATKEQVEHLDYYYDNSITYIKTHNGIKIASETIAKADTIEDLCNGVLVEEKGNPNNWFIMETDEFIETPKDEIMIKNWTYRAFIKTNKGLIYVAELKNGELELL